ncbi:MAG: hypothetical protein WB810_00690 [Candidatus Cybelea sp.]
MNLVICFILTLAALSPTPQITGTIVDYHRKLVSGVPISVVALYANQTIEKTLYGSDGSFHFTDLALALTEPRSLNPLYLESIFALEIGEFGFSYLTNYDADGAVVPDVAREVPTLANGGISANGKRITFRLRHDVLWQDGTPLTSRDRGVHTL